MRLFLTGTDTAVGKTYVAALLVRALRRAGLDAVGMKPICCGERDDVRALWEASGKRLDLSLDALNPVWLRPPAAPYTAAIIEDRVIDLEAVREAFRKLNASHRAIIVEGVGGWKVPILRDYDVSDLAADLGLPVAVVVHNRLGAINHTLLTVESIRRCGLICAGLIINNFGPQSEIASTTNTAILEDLTQLPVLFDIKEGQTSLELALA